MAKPLIGLTTYQSRNPEGLPASSLLHAYSEAILRVGGLPLLIPLSFGDKSAELANLVERLDGVVFTGGGDIDPGRYAGSGRGGVAGVDPGRDLLELQLFELLVERRKPILGICRGMQLMNVALGGDLFADFLAEKPGSKKHDYFPDWPRPHLAHEVKLLAGESLARLLGQDSLLVNSLHHQGVRRLASALRVLAVTEDDLVEAVEYVDYPFAIGVQWHPEWLMDQDASQRIFKAFVSAAGNAHG